MIAFGYQALFKGAVRAGCSHFFGCPITPQNEVTELFAREFPKEGGLYIQAQCEIGSIMQVYGAAACGVRAMTSTSGPGWSIMLEGMSQASRAELPLVVVLVQRGGPGGGAMRQAQQDYFSACWGGGHGGYKNIVLAPASVQELHDFIQLAFYLADKYRNPVVILTDAVVVAMADTLEEKTLDFGPLPPKDWAVRGRAKQKDGKPRLVTAMVNLVNHPSYLAWVEHEYINSQKMREAEVRYESLHTEGAELILVAHGYVAKVCKEVLNMARSEGLRVGLIRPITCWPFPHQAIKEKVLQGCQFLVVEDNLGQMVEDVRLGAEGQAKVHLVNMLVRHEPNDLGMIRQDSVFKEVKRLLGEG